LNAMARFEGHLVVQQRVLPAYRVPFFEHLASACDRLTVVAGLPRPAEAIAPAEGMNQGEWVRLRNRHWFGGRGYLCTQPGLVGELERLAPDALVLEANPRYLSNWRARTWAHTSGISVLGWGLGAEPSGWISGWVWRTFLRGMDGMIAYSSRGAEAYRRLGVPRDKVGLAINAVGSPPSEPPTRAAEGHRRLRVLFVGRLQPRKRLDTLLRACASLAEPPEVTIVGDGPQKPALESLAAQRLPGTVFSGHLEGRALEEAFAWADLFVLPGTGGLAVQQAMAHGLPVVVGEGDGTAEDLVRAGNGWRVSLGDEPALAQIMAQAASDRGRLASMGAESYRIVAEEVNLDAMVTAFVKTVTRTAGRA
jgi:glycosyltransferase involved in cell wall biosynthesis